MAKAIIYSRVSTTDQKEKGYSLKEQERLLIQYCKKENITVLNSYVEDYSAKNFDRPVFRELLEFAKQHSNEIDYLLVYKWDRFSRNITESYEYIDKFKKLSIEVNSINEWIDHSVHMSQYMLAFSLVNPDVENRVRSDRVTTGMRASLKEGRWCSSIPTGYKKGRDSNDKPLMSINEEIAGELRQLFQDFSTGNYTQAELIRKYNSDKLKLNKTKFNKMLRNRLYAGEIYIKSNETEQESIVKGIHEPLISKEVFNNIQRVLNGRRPISNQMSKHDHLLPLRGLLICDNCGRKLTGTTKTKKSGKKYSYYHGYSKYKCECKVPTNELHNQVEVLLKKLKPNKEIKELILNMVKESETEYRGDTRTEKNKIKKELDEINLKKNKLIDKFVEDQIAKEDYNRYILNLDNKKFELETKFSELSYKVENIEELVSNTMKYFESLGNVYSKSNPKQKRMLMSSILDENLRIQNKKFRTPKFKEIVHLLCTDSKAFKELGIKKGDSKKEESPMVIPRGFEPLLPP